MANTYYESITVLPNGASPLTAFSRVVWENGTLRVAGDDEQEYGLVVADAEAGGSAQVISWADFGTKSMIANGPISSGAVVYRAADGKVSATGTDVIGRAYTAANADGELIEVAQDPTITPGAPGGGLSGLTPTAVVFVSGSGSEAQDAGSFNYDSTTKRMEVPALARTVANAQIDVYGGAAAGGHVGVYGPSHATLASVAVVDGASVLLRDATGTTRVTVDSTGLTTEQHIIQKARQQDLGSKGTNFTADFSTGKPIQLATLTANLTVSITNPTYKDDYCLILKQDATGGRIPTLPAFVGGTPIINTAANAQTLIRFYFDGTNRVLLNHRPSLTTVSELGTTHAANGDWVQVSGYGNANDGGGGRFRYDSGSSATIDSGYAFAAPSGTGRWLRILDNNEIRPQHFTNSLTVTDWHTAIEAAATAAKAVGATLRLPKIAAGFYITTATIDLPSEINVIMDDPVRISGGSGTDLVCIKVGTANSADITNKKMLVLQAYRETLDDWGGSTGDIGILLYNLDNCRVWIPQASRFARGVVCRGHDTGCEYNHFFLNQLLDNQVGFEMEPAGTLGWCNQNNIYGGSFIRGSLTNTTQEAIGVRLGQGTSVAPANNNVFHNPSFELATGGTGMPVQLLGGARDNAFKDCRHEHSGDVFMRVAAGAAATRNWAELLYTDVDVEDHELIDDQGTRPGTNWVSSGRRIETERRPSYSVWTSKNWGRFATQSPSGNVHIPGIHFKDRNANTKYFVSNEVDYTIGSDYLQIASGDLDGIGVYVEGLDKCKIIRANVSLAAGSPSVTWVVICYNSAGSIISGLAPQYARFLSASSTSGWGGGYFRSASPAGPMVITFHDDVHSAEILVAGNGQTPQIKCLEVAALERHPIMVRSWFSKDNGGERWATSPPDINSGGTYEQGEIIRNANFTNIDSQNTVVEIDLGDGQTGTYAIEINGQTTSALAANADTATIQAAINALLSVQSAGGGKPADVTVAGVGGEPPNNPFTLTYDGYYANRLVPLPVVDTSSLGTPGAVTVGYSQQGRAGQDVLAWRMFPIAAFPYWVQVPRNW